MVCVHKLCFPRILCVCVCGGGGVTGGVTGGVISSGHNYSHGRCDIKKQRFIKMQHNCSKIRCNS